MSLPEGYFVIHQPKYRIPSVFDLHPRGTFGFKPSVTRDYGFRTIAALGHQVKIQCLRLIESGNNTAGERCTHRISETLFDLDRDLGFDARNLDVKAFDAAVREELVVFHREWRNGFLPLTPDGRADRALLVKKIDAAIDERREALRRESVRKNSAWVKAALPRLCQDFRRGIFHRVADRLMTAYRALGGVENEEGLVVKSMIFQCIFDNPGEDPLAKPDGGRWKDEDEIWECWVGFAGSESEAKRVCEALNTVLRPLRQEVAA